MLSNSVFVATSIAGAGLCAAIVLGQGGGSPALAETVAPAADTPAMGWHLSHEGGRAKLAYGAARSDHILVMFACAPGEETVEVFGMAAPEAEPLVLASTAGATAVRDAVTHDPMTGGLVVEADLPLRARALEGFRQTGWLSLTGAEGERYAANARPEEMADVEAFFRHCSVSRT